MKKNPKNLETQEPEQPAGKKKPDWLKISIIADIVVVALIAIVLAGVEVEHQSNTNPKFCALCHVMQYNVNSYLTGNNLDHVHALAGVQCKDCHNYPISSEVSSGIKYITGNYTTTSAGSLPQMKFDDAMCTKCHISEQHVAQLTDFLTRNPHDSHFGPLPCSTCHISHGQQVDYCATCHDNGGQRMIGAPITPRGTISGSSTSDNHGGSQTPQSTPAAPAPTGG
ncbi:MAG: cytochrome c3 family protein [Anaerolineaceae bacterium]|nr:cytochrome c3 family protein [Anaerolineaceae bacterium]